MKKLAFFFCSAIIFAACSTSNEPTKRENAPTIEARPVHGSVSQASFNVSGNCETCQETIEEATRLKGVTFCSWDTLSKVCVVTFDSRETNVDAIEKAIAAAGYDNDGYIAPDKAYEELPTCCQYDRKK